LRYPNFDAITFRRTRNVLRDSTVYGKRFDGDIPASLSAKLPAAYAEARRLHPNADTGFLRAYAMISAPLGNRSQGPIGAPSRRPVEK
jgi:hypothetical protein